MRLLFCNIAWMNYYKGIIPGLDEPYGGGSYVLENKDAHEKYNFDPVRVRFEDGEEQDVCFGFTETKMARSGKKQDLHIEKIEGCEACTKEACIEDVTVIYCAARPYQNFTSVVGWYRHANVYRQYQELVLPQPDGSDYYQYYNAEAMKENCVLLPKDERRITQWNVPRRQKGAAFGFGQANVWFTEGRRENKLLDEFIRKTIDKIENYQGENWIDFDPESVNRRRQGR